LFYLLPLAAFPGDALAWGLQTHLYFAQYVVLLLPLADAELRAAVASLPRLVLAGACLPDFALAGKMLGTPAFRRAHRWSTLRRLAAAARDGTERALVVGYASHLVADVVAHNRFVPEHEARIARLPHLIHAIAEFAMDEHVRGCVPSSPSEALESERRAVVDFIERAFPCGRPLAERARSLLARADRTLRASPIPRLCRRIVGLYYRDPAYRFDGYAAVVKAKLGELEAALAGEFIDWASSDPEGRTGDTGADRGARGNVARVVQPQYDA
jgi:hypothetical protein